MRQFQDSAPTTNMGGCGGAGSPNDITGSAVTYAGGGGGFRRHTPGSGINVPQEHQEELVVSGT